jgi:4-aminobutyrate aminotransferase-like enzyme
MDFDDVSTGSTWSWLPASCAAALETLATFAREPILENVRELEAAAAVALTPLMEKYPQIGDVRAVGCFIAVEFVKDRTTKERDMDLTLRVAWECLQQGLLVDASTTSLNLQPSLVMPVDTLRQAFEILDAAIARAAA